MRLQILSRWLSVLGSIWAATASVHAAAEPDVLPPPAPRVDQEPLSVRRDATVAAIAKVMPSVVNISATTMVDGTDPQTRFMADYFGWQIRRQFKEVVYSRGSGVVIDEDGYVLTNVHVIKNAKRVFVKFNDQKEELEADVVEFSTPSDLALLKIKSPPGRTFKPIRFAPDDDLLIGETVIALGNPFGLSGSVSKGILSAKARRPQNETPGDPNGALDTEDWIQTDAAINPGNSGGPLVNLDGELIGINVAIFRPDFGAQGIGFAIPIKRVNETLAQILTGESIKGLWFGARLESATRPFRIQTVQPGSPADKAGLQPGDTVISINGLRPQSVLDFNRELQAAADQRDINLVLERSGKRTQTAVRMIRESSFFNADYVRRRLGAVLESIPGPQAERLGVRSGLVVSSIERSGPAAAAGLEKGMIVVAANDEAVRDPSALAKQLYKKKRGDSVNLAVLITERIGPAYRRYVGEVEIRLK